MLQQFLKGKKTSTLSANTKARLYHLHELYLWTPVTSNSIVGYMINYHLRLQ